MAYHSGFEDRGAPPGFKHKPFVPAAVAAGLAAAFFKAAPAPDGTSPPV